MESFNGLGAAFYPEHHPKKTWKEHIGLMAKSGISFVRMGEFAWDKMELEEGRFDFEWLDEVFSLLAKHNIGVLMCTPTATPPIWACKKYPDIHPVLQDGKTMGFGMRRYTCPTSRKYHSLCESIVTRLAKHYVGNNQVIGWQIDNEVGAPFCFCERCLKHFQQWCEKRFYTIENFNDAHETHFWGQTLQKFSQIPFPNTAPSPSLWISYHKFFSEITINCFSKQAAWLKENGVNVPVTSNMMITWYGYDHTEMAEYFDLIAGDYYSGKSIFGEDFAGEAFVNAYLRGMKSGKPIWFNEFQCDDFPLPGQVRLWTLTQIGLGANQISYFRWDTCPSGFERGGYGLLRHCRQPGRVFREIKKLSDDLKKLKPLLDETRPVTPEVAVLYTYENHYEFAEYKKLDEFSGPCGNGYALHLAKHFRAIAGSNIPVDIVYPGQNFSRYKCIIAPALYVLPEKLGKTLNEYIKNGGQVLLTALSGVVDENAKELDIPIPGPVRDSFGIRVLDFGQYLETMGDMRLVSHESVMPLPCFKLTKWIEEILVDKGTEVLATYSGKFFNKIPAFTKKDSGKGKGFYLGTLLETTDYYTFYKIFLASLGIKPIMKLPKGIHVSCRQNEGVVLYFISNETAEDKEIDLSDSYIDAITGSKIKARIKMPPFGVRILMSS
ncbi:MAG: beta-galactosidase [Candidatus Omnitrophota bacterium]